MTLEIAMEIMEAWNSDGMNSVDNIDNVAVEVAGVLYQALLDAPKNTAPKSDYAKCPHFGTIPMFNEDTGKDEPLHICTSGGHFA